MPYNSQISRSEAQALVPENVSNALLQGLSNKSAAMTLFRRVTMPTNQTRFPVLATLPTAYFVSGDTGLKQTSDTTWGNKYLNAEELAAIVPIPEAVLDDVNYDIWGTVQPLMEDAVARALDAAIFFGTNKPTSWPEAIVPAIDALNQEVTRGTAAATAGGLAKDISDAFDFVEADGFDVNGMIAIRTYRGKLRNVRDAEGRRMEEVSPTQAYGVDIQYPMRGQWPTGSGVTEAILGDFTQGILGVRKDFTYKILTEAVITDDQGQIIYNLAQQDMVAMRLVFRCAFQVSNLVTYDNPTEATRFPFARIVAP